MLQLVINNSACLKKKLIIDDEHCTNILNFALHFSIARMLQIRCSR